VKKPKIYLDTSVISHLDQANHPKWTENTLKFWEQLKSGRFDVLVSTVVDMEIDDCKEVAKRAKLRGFLDEIEYTMVNIDKEIEDVAKLFIDNDILKPNCMDDALHLAVAMIYNCDSIVSWNFKHIVNYDTITGVKVVAALSGYGKDDIAICTPEFFVRGEE
jgi:predicted nucleic acid-binding protein